MIFRNENGFTLIELLVSVAIIGILVAIAVPNFKEYRVRAQETRAFSALHHLITVQEAYYADNENYTTFGNSDYSTVESYGFSGLGDDIIFHSAPSHSSTGSDTFSAGTWYGRPGCYLGKPDYYEYSSNSGGKQIYKNWLLGGLSHC